MFLLKGHEDLRQDERVMQLFGLVNTLLANDPASLRKNLRHVKNFCVNLVYQLLVQENIFFDARNIILDLVILAKYWIINVEM